MRRATLVSMLVLVVSLVGAGGAQARLDPGFGQEGAATVTPPLPSGWSNQRLEAAVTGQNGETYVIVRQSSCANYPCLQGDFLFRYQANGALEPAFAGSRGYEIPPETPNSYEVGQPLVTVDSSGLPVVGRTVSTSGENGTAIVVRRLLGNGELDTGFAAQGAVRLPCPCGSGTTQLLTGPHDSTFVVATSETRKKRSGQKSGATGSATLIKLDSTGHRAKGFGLRGSVTATAPGEGKVEYDAITPDGATYFGGRGLTKSTDAGFLLRVSKKGVIDTKFEGRALKALKRLKAIKGNEVRVTTAVVGETGPIELFGSAGSIGGFELRLRPNGSLLSGWAEDGLALLPYPIATAVQGRQGSIMALTGEEGAAPHLLRILSNGKLDPAFGATGEVLPGATLPTGYSLYPAGLGRVGVTGLGQPECRSSTCQVTGNLWRFLEGS
ncbi:MAG TPA: hypothetical protein VHS74_17395 [Solirubrobacterales bacterium]|nr:hypothetical protein [Solirubrobacterales bacterium]